MPPVMALSARLPAAAARRRAAVSPPSGRSSPPTWPSRSRGSSSCCWSRPFRRWWSPPAACPRSWLMVATVLGGRAAAGGANAINMVVDRDIDRLMERTKGRPLVTGELTPRAALDLRHRPRGRGLRSGSGRTVNLLSAVLAVSATPLLRLRLHAVAQAPERAQHRHRRRRRRRAGARRLDGGHRRAWTGRRSCCSPSSSTGPRRTSGPSPSATATTTPPPTCRCSRRCATPRWSPRRILAYTLLLWALTLLFAPVADMGGIYLVAAVVLGAVFTWLRRAAPRGRRRRRWPCASSATPSPTSPCCSAPWPSTSWSGSVPDRAGEIWEDPASMGDTRA